MTLDDDMTQANGRSRAERVALWGGAVWALGVLAYALMGDGAAMAPALLPWIVAILPGTVAWLWADAARRTRTLESDIDALTARLVSMREQIEVLQDSQGPQNNGAELTEKVNQIAKAQEKTESTLAVFLSSRGPAAAEAQARTSQPPPMQRQDTLLPKQITDPQAPLSHEDFIRAANFPRNAEDRVGFAVLRLALANDKTNAFIRSAQDILTLLSQQGIYMDDLSPDKTMPEVWRAFGAGQRGADIAPLGAIRDRKLLEKVAAKMRDDTVFRDAVHHFLRKFDRVFTEFCEDASDEDLRQFAETRSARAFMLLGRIAGTFD